MRKIVNKKKYRLRCGVIGLIVFFLGIFFSDLIQANELNINEKFIINKGQIGFIKMGMSTTEIEQIVREQYDGIVEKTRENVINEESKYGEKFVLDVINFYLNVQNSKVRVIRFAMLDDVKIFTGQVYSPLFRTKEGICVLSRGAEVKKAYPQAKIVNNASFGYVLEIPEVGIFCFFESKTKFDCLAVSKNQHIFPDDLIITRIVVNI